MSEEDQRICAICRASADDWSHRYFLGHQNYFCWSCVDKIEHLEKCAAAVDLLRGKS